MSSQGEGWTLVEVILATAVSGATLLIILALVPLGVASLQRAQDLQAATAYGQEVVSATRAGLLPLYPRWSTAVTCNKTTFRVSREVLPVPDTEGRLADVVVTIAWSMQPRPVVLTTRVDRRRIERLAPCPQRSP